MFICLSAVTMKSFCRTFFKKIVGSRGKAPRGIFKGNALKLPKINSKFATRQILSYSETLFIYTTVRFYRQ